LKSLNTARKALEDSQNCPKVYHDQALTRMQIQVFIKSAVGETAAAADQRNLTARASITDFAPEVKNNRGECVTKLVQAHDA
jgi:hypothetical protein